jgi:hypothetical protein
VRWKVAGPLLAVAVAIAVAAAVALSRPSNVAPPAAEPEPVEVTSDAPRVSSLEDLAAAADLVVRAEVIGTQPGRVFGEPGGAAVESRMVTLRVDRVIAGAPPGGDTLVVEEEGWLEDGTPLIVDGAAPSAVGDDGIWFLSEVSAGDAPVYVVVSAQGRYLVDGERLRGASGDDALVAELSALAPDELATEVAALPTGAE